MAGAFRVYYEIKLMVKSLQRQVDRIEAILSSLTSDLKVPHSIESVHVISVSSARTVEVLKTFNEPKTASEVAAVTGRARANESLHLNELARNGIVKKEKRGHKYLFTLREV